jgi:hypothetical protein
MLVVGGMAAAERGGSNKQTEQNYIIGELENVTMMRKWKSVDERNTQHASQ